jgi:hypothetical protein
MAISLNGLREKMDSKLMTMGQEHGPFGRAERGHDKGTGKMNKSLLMLCIISLPISTPSASARPRRDEWRPSLI